MTEQQTLDEYGASTNDSDETNPERYKNPDWLRQEYVEKCRHATEIADDLDVTVSTVRYWLKKHDIRTRSRGEAQLVEAPEELRDSEWLYEYYVEKRWSTYEIAEEFDVDSLTVNRWLRRHEIEIRSGSDSRFSDGEVVDKLRNKEWLWEQYVSQHQPVTTIADELDAGPSTVLNWLRRHNIEIRSTSESMLPPGAADYLQDSDWLREQYEEKRRSAEDIADEIGASPTAVRNWLERHGIEIRSSGETRLPEQAIERLQDEEWLREQYVVNRRSADDIASELGVGTTTVYRRLRRSGIETRSGSESRLSEDQVKKLQDREWLEKQYTENRRTAPDIAEELGVGTTTVQRWLENHGIKIRSAAESRLPEHAVDLLRDGDWLREQYEEKRRSAEDIADEIGASPDAVRNWLEEHGVEIRSSRETRLPEQAIEQLQDEEWLREQYVEDRRSARRIADDIGVSSHTLYNWLDHHGVETRSNWAAQLSEDAVEQHKKLQDEEWLRTQYVEDRRSMADIADELEVDSSTVEGWLRRYGVSIRSYSESRLSEQAVERVHDETWLRRQYVEKRRTLDDIADELGMSHKGVLNWLVRHDIETRSISESKLPANSVEKLHSEDWMRQEYEENYRAAVDIADELDVGATTVYTWLDRHEIEVRSGFQDPDHLDHIVRSTWELQIAELLNAHDIEYKYEEIEINWKEDRIYTPDFVTEGNVIEVKGRLYESGEQEKARAAMRELEDREYVVVGTELPCDIHVPWEDRDSLVDIV